MEKQIIAEDGTVLRYRLEGDSGPWLVLANGLGGGQSIWNDICDYLGQSHRILRWDYRGMYDGDESPDIAPTHVVGTLAKDLLGILHEEKIEAGAWIGWSLGTQVLLEALRQGPAKPSTVVLINPCFGRGDKNIGWRHHIGELLFDTLRSGRSLLDPVVKKLVLWPETPSWAERLGLIDRSANLEQLGEAARHLAKIDWGHYVNMLEAASRHRVDGFLADIDVPTLAVLGERDPINRLADSEPLARQIPNVEVFVVKGATHFTPIEHPEVLNLRIEKFLRDHAVSHPLPPIDDSHTP